MTTTESLCIKKGCSQSTDPAQAAQELYEAIAQPGISFAIFHCSSEYDLDLLGRELKTRFEGVNLIGCTTAGEITPAGYLNGALTGVSIASDDLDVELGCLDGLHEFRIADGEALGSGLLQRLSLHGDAPTGLNTFGLLLIDGLSMSEEPVVSAINRSLGEVQLFGGSAGDGLRFESTYVYYDGKFHTDSAILALVKTGHPFEVFRTQHFVETEDKMVVTQADPSRRIVTEINGEPAVREYARLVGLDVDKLTPMIFAAHPVVVRVGGSYYVRSIQKVNDDESLSLFCAIDEGIVLTVARGVDMVNNLKELFSNIQASLGVPRIVLGCDCILRNLEMDQKGLRGAVSEILMANNVIGFSTYGEQYNGMHVNQTFTGVAIGSK